MEQKIVGFHLDEEEHWVADLVCGHKQHVRHEPPFFPREWVTNPSKRKQHLGTLLNCKRCDEVGVVVAKAVQQAAFDALKEAQKDATAAALCKEGQVELAMDRLQGLDLKKLSREAIASATGEHGTLTDNGEGV